MLLSSTVACRRCGVVQSLFMYDTIALIDSNKIRVHNTDLSLFPLA